MSNKRKITKLNETLKSITREANFLSLTGNISISLFGFAAFALLARSYSLENFGEWVLLISSAAFVDMFRFGITNTAIIRYLSGADAEERPRLIGSFLLIILVVTFLVSVLIWGAWFLFSGPIRHAGYALFFIYYPLLAFINIPMNIALTIMQSELRFDRILIINTLYSGSFFLIIFLNFLFLDLTLEQIVMVQFSAYLAVSLCCVLLGWDGTRYLFKATRRTNKVLIDFGKYTTLTLIGTNLLRSADTLIISLSPLGTAAVALYSIPMKLTELQQIPLRSFAATAFPKMSRESIKGNLEEVRNLFYTYSGAMTYLFAFISLTTFIFAGPFIMIMGGSQYLVTDAATGANTIALVRILSLYGLLLPFERMTGIGLDSINRPAKNFQKVMYMVIANIIGDLIAVFVFKSLEAVAIGSVLFTLFGVWLGYYFLNKSLSLERKKIFTHGIGFYKMMYQKMKSVTI